MRQKHWSHDARWILPCLSNKRTRRPRVCHSPATNSTRLRSFAVWTGTCKFRQSRKSRKSHRLILILLIIAVKHKRDQNTRIINTPRLCRYSKWYHEHHQHVSSTLTANGFSRALKMEIWNNGKMETKKIPTNNKTHPISMNRTGNTTTRRHDDTDDTPHPLRALPPPRRTTPRRFRLKVETTMSQHALHMYPANKTNALGDEQ